MRCRRSCAMLTCPSEASMDGARDPSPRRERGESWSTWTRTRTNRTKICCAANYTIDHWIDRAVTPVRSALIADVGAAKSCHTWCPRDSRGIERARSGAAGFGEHVSTVTGRGTGPTLPRARAGFESAGAERSIAAMGSHLTVPRQAGACVRRGRLHKGRQRRHFPRNRGRQW